MDQETLRGKDVRIFRMTPFHHHLELGGLSGNGQNWSEWKVDAFMWSIALVTSVVTLVFSTYKTTVGLPIVFLLTQRDFAG